SKYKSEFLANMSHELRTPLNSLLILAQQLYENPEGNLTDKQVSFAKTIHSCGDDLIQLINDILDLSKIESGFISVNFIKVRFREIGAFAENTFRPISEAKQLKFNLDMDAELPEIIETDIQRLNQILKNLLSNAFKFTEKGEVKLHIYKANKNWKTKNPILDEADSVIAFAISDTGIGIPRDKQNIIFEAFQQAEGSTSRKYGGTGLGLSISRGLAELLYGTIELDSQLNTGSTFTLFLPLKIPNDRSKNITIDIDSSQALLENVHMNQVNLLENYTSSLGKNDYYKKNIAINNDLDLVNEMINETGDDRANIQAQEDVLLIVEDDLNFAKIMIAKAHESGIKAVVATNYGEVFYFANTYNPIAVTLDIKLPDASGWRVLDLFKNDLNLRHIPIHLISGEENKALAHKRGARSFLLKPIKNEDLTDLYKDIITFGDKNFRELLLVEDNEIDASHIAQLFSDDKNIKITIAHTGAEAIKLLDNNSFDCYILDYSLPDISLSEMIHEINSRKQLSLIPIIIHSAKDFNPMEAAELRKTAHSIILKDARSFDVLYEEIIKNIHVVHASLPEQKRKIVENILIKEDILKDKNILIVDDDVRNLFALTTAFERYNINAVTAESGREAINILNDPTKDIDLVLMDIMMPEMDGYETTQKIRRENKNNTLPIIAVTAKAMKGDRQKCIEAGASDYITKPVKVDQLLSLMRVWLHK
ncbi:MAG TPA: response regulator, partial [Cytophagaceae bacterium]|nr:response regulator [Cytophagaceae bacterium]